MIRMEEAEGLCRRVDIIHLGKIVAIGTPVKLKAAIGGNGASLDEVSCAILSNWL
jgi:ABC-2 type transport system ATP-binding protein